MCKSTNISDGKNSNQSKLPNPKSLIWAHSTCSKDLLDKALGDHNITAIEADIVMGHEMNDLKEVCPKQQPIMAHPPLFVSDLTFEEFIKRSLTKGNAQDQQCRLRNSKHLKLDIKEQRAIELVLTTLKSVLSAHKVNNEDVNVDVNKLENTIFLNADILEGPGCRSRPLGIEAEEFIEKCLTFTDFIHQHNRDKIAMSLGWKTDCRSFEGYTEDDVKKMCGIIEHYDLIGKTAGVVLAVNARVLIKGLTPFDEILKSYPTIQLLIWTGTSEPPIPEFYISRITQHFQSIGCEHQLGFDCQVSHIASRHEVLSCVSWCMILELTLTHLNVSVEFRLLPLKYLEFSTILPWHWWVYFGML